LPPLETSVWFHGRDWPNMSMSVVAPPIVGRFRVVDKISKWSRNSLVMVACRCATVDIGAASRRQILYSS
jgi:hypothetical protein